MCTVSVIQIGDRLDRAIRAVCNRDELRTRPPALPPEVRVFGARRAIMPVDPVSGGTWIAVNDAGLVMTLLNSRPTTRRAIDAPPVSRGTIIPRLLGSSTFEQAVESALNLRSRDYEPFRLLVLDLESLCEVVSDGMELRTFRTAMDARPLLFTSSSLGDEVVERPRRELFERLVSPSATAAAQDAFHRHVWAGREHVSVQMSRADARTVSRTKVELSPRGARITYEPVGDVAALAPTS